MLRLGLVTILTFGSMMLASDATATVRGTEVFLPSIGCGEGVEDSSWTSTIWVHNPGESAANVQFFFLVRDQANPAPQVYNDTVAAGETKLFTNPTNVMFGSCGFGAIRVISDRTLVVNSRVQATPDGGTAADTLGQGFEAIPVGFAIGKGQRSSVLGVRQGASDSDYRYNFGIVETTGFGADVMVTARDNSGQEVASETYFLGGWESRQLNLSVLVPDVDSDNMRLEFEVTSDSGRVIAFGSGITNGSNDATTFKMEVEDQSHHQVIGTWFGRAFPVDPETSPFAAAVMIPTFFPDGTFMASDSLEVNFDHGGAHGYWYIRDDGTIIATGYWLNMDDDQSDSGHTTTLKLRLTLSLTEGDPDSIEGFVDTWIYLGDTSPADPEVGIPAASFTLTELRRLRPAASP